MHTTFYEMERTLICSFCQCHMSWHSLPGDKGHYILSVAVMPQLLLPSALPLIHIVCHFLHAFSVGCCPVFIFKWLLWDQGIDGLNSMISMLLSLEGFSSGKRNPSNISAIHVGHWKFSSGSLSGFHDPFVLLTYLVK